MNDAERNVNFEIAFRIDLKFKIYEGDRFYDRPEEVNIIRKDNAIVLSYNMLFAFKLYSKASFF